MTVLGDSSKPSGGWHSFSGSSQNQQEAERLTVPEGANVTELGCWVGGWNGTCRVYLCCWDDAGALLASAGPSVVANQGAGGPAGGNVALLQLVLATPVRLHAGDVIFVGLDRHVDDGHQVSVGGSGSPDHYHGRHGGSGAAWPGNLGAAPGGITNQVRRIGAFAVYEPVAGAKVYRSGAWTDADAVQVMRAGVLTDVDAVQVRRGAAWIDAE